ncbi:MAG: asparagine synthase (glutamine-hydrolyzing), partial [Acidobacteriaceae bacterium]|nr:asparagine synthase (glutamine-hydrolyzing) [Acidobacteriaceae bacterium]
EIYNHAELRRGLEIKGHVFRSDHSDTEVLVHGYEEWGEDLPGKLNGMFAFVVLDRRRRRLFLARDRFGEKPLYYAKQNGLFAFASELSAIAQHRNFEARVDRQNLQKFLAYGFLPSPNAYLENAWKLPGGCFLVYELERREVSVSRYWRFSLAPDDRLEARPESELVEELQALLSEAVRRRLLSDVPLGLFLSGGLDSSAVLWGAAQNLANDLRTFTVGFTEPSFDESDHAEAAAKAFGTRHQMERLDLDTARDLIPYVLSRLDEPLGDASILPTYMLSRFTRRHVTVALSGDGGDELFAGYDPFVVLPWARLYHSSVPQPLHRFIKGAIYMLPISARNMSLDFKLRRTLAGMSYLPEIWNPVWLSPAEPAMIADLFEEPVAAEELYSEAIALWSSEGRDKSDVDRTLEFYTNFYLQDDILTKVDRASMMCSLESRAVFLDNDLVDYCQRLPTRFKYRKGRRKYLLRRAMEGVLPPRILARPKKGFGIPLARWLRTVPTTPPLGALPGVQLDRVVNAWNEHRSGRADHRLLLWSWLSLQHTCAAGLG